jgi:hypothetical protein
VSAYDRRRKRRNPWRGRLAWALLLALVFAIGIALGQALEDNPTPPSTVTQDRTFTLPPPAATVTVTAP